MENREKWKHRVIAARKRIPFTLWQTEWLQLWLEEQSKNGLRLEGIIWPGIAEFSRSSHTHRQYKILSYEAVSDAIKEETEEKPYPAEMDARLTEYGWAIAAEWQHHYILYRRDPFPQPLPQEKPDHWKNLRSSDAATYIGTWLTMLAVGLNTYCSFDASVPAYPAFVVLLGVAFLLMLAGTAATFWHSHAPMPVRDVRQQAYRRAVRRGFGPILLAVAMVLVLILQLCAAMMN